MSEASGPRGILKNAAPEATYKKESINEFNSEKVRFDRQQVIKNTRLNSELKGLNAKQGELIRKRLANQAKIVAHSVAQNAASALGDDALKWDEKNLLLNEQEKSATMKIDEPKTPYEGGFNPNNEYYKPDEDTTGEEEVDDIDLGEGVEDSKDVIPKDRIEVVKTETPAENEPAIQEQKKELTPEEKHRLFELKRRQHYHMKGSVLKEPLPVSDSDEEDEKDAN